MTQPHPQRCETCDNHVITGRGEDCKISDHTPTTAERLFVSKVGCASHSSTTHAPAAPAEPVKFPNSTELLLMAHTDWKNRIERKHTHDEIPWTDGWIHGYLTPKPDWKRKEQHDTAIRNATLDEAINVVNAFERKPKYDYEVTKCLLITQSLEALKKKVETQ